MVDFLAEFLVESDNQVKPFLSFEECAGNHSREGHGDHLVGVGHGNAIACQPVTTVGDGHLGQPLYLFDGHIRSPLYP